MTAAKPAQAKTGGDSRQDGKAFQPSSPSSLPLFHSAFRSSGAIPVFSAQAEIRFLKRSSASIFFFYRPRRKWRSGRIDLRWERTALEGMRRFPGHENRAALQ